MASTVCRKNAEYDQPSSFDLDIMIEKAQRYLFDTTRRSKGSKQPSSITVESVRQSDFACDESLRLMATSLAPTMSAVSPILIDSPDFGRMQMMSDFESSIFLHNFALSYICSSHKATKPCTAATLREAAKKILSMAQTVISNEHDEIDCMDYEWQSALVEALMLRNLVALYNEADDANRTRLLYKRLVAVREDLQDIGLFHAKLKVPLCPAAAA